MKRSSYNGVLLLSLFLLMSSAVFLCISGQSADGIGTRMAGANNIIISGEINNGCYPDSSRRKGAFCCNKDNFCWPTLQDCLPNCPCCVKDRKPNRSPNYD
ncbi:hypothetical protein EJB05_39965 [Eragrostis curvula]|uniref:Embryo surrounding factor 1 brassicaceae domain-containing protein n=1 Tax=Eragrostis curvula TaxID=38414 RepID=A0A5J9TYR3_9POAL|nr:hypothetical protein EJB05_39965 [Eragrostis curvula]